MAGTSFNALLDWRPRPDEPVNAQITRFVKALVVDGALDTSAPLPTIHDLAKQWGTNYFTVQSAFSPLVKQGLLTRRRRVGTFARSAAKRLRSVGIFFGSDVLSTQDHPFYHLLLSLLQQRLSDGDIACKVFFDRRSEKEFFNLHPSVGAAIDAGEIQALIVAVGDMRHNQWLSKLTVPTAFCGSSEGDNRIWFDHAQFAALALRHLATKGHRTVGLITPVNEKKTDHHAAARNDFIAKFPPAAAAHGVRLEEKWILSGKPDSISHQQFGYEQFKKFAALKNRPDALIVFPDDCARGVVSGILETGVRIPDELELVFHKNEGIDLFCPFPAAFITNNPVKVADALIDLTTKQFEGKQIQKIILPYKLEDNT